MELEDIIKCFKQTDVTRQDFENFARPYAILDEPFVQEILHNWEVPMSNPASQFTCMTVEDADLVLKTLKSPAPGTSESDVDDGFEPWTAQLLNPY